MLVRDYLRDLFRERAGELLEALEDTLLDLEKRPDDKELLWRCFRVMHTLKGSGSMFGFDGVSELCHKIETVIKMAIDGELMLTRDVINIILASHDMIRSMLDAPCNDSFEKSDKFDDIMACLTRINQSADAH